MEELSGSSFFFPEGRTYSPPAARAVVSLLPVGNVRSPRELRFLREAAGCGLHKGLRKKHDSAEVTTKSDFLFIGESYQPWHRPFCGGSFRLHEL